MAETTAARKKKRDTSGRMMLRFTPEVCFALEEMRDELGLLSVPSVARFLVHEALVARGLDRRTLRAKYEEHLATLPAQSAPRLPAPDPLLADV